MRRDNKAYNLLKTDSFNKNSLKTAMNQKNSNISKGDQETDLNLEEDSENINNTNNAQTVGVDV